MAGMMKKAMEMKQNVEKLKEQLADETMEASAGGGMVTVVMNGKFELLSVKIDPEVIEKDESEMLESLVQAAVNEAVGKVQEMVKSKMQEMTGGLQIPGLTS
ncbi:MAG: YbaB/EbfC family nucleoid-associated protein [bacterium]|nr:YbaB/EbfC family nucleoid-associated protein [bacterium]